MVINWQDVFYFMASVVMIVVFITCIWLMWLFFIVSKQIERFKENVQEWNNKVEGIKYLGKGIELKVLNFILKFLDKGSKHEKE